MPGTANGIADDDALCQRPGVVRAGGADRQHLVAYPRQNDGFFADVPLQQIVVAKCRKRNSGCEVGAGLLVFMRRHAGSPSIGCKALAGRHPAYGSMLYPAKGSAMQAALRSFPA